MSFEEHMPYLQSDILPPSRDKLRFRLRLPGLTVAKGCMWASFPMQPLALCEIWSHNSKALESYSIERLARPRGLPRCWRMVLMGAWDAVPCQGGRLGRPMYEKKASGHRQQQYLSYIEGPNPPSWHVTARSAPSMTWQGYICHVSDRGPSRSML